MVRTQKGTVPWSFLNPFDIRKGEGKKTLLMFCYSFLTIAVLYILKPVRSSLFLEELGSHNLRYVYLGEGVFLLFVTWAYIYLAKRLSKRRLFIGVLLFFISNLVLFWWFFRSHIPYLSAYFYIWVACFSITAVTQFWTLANDIFDPLEAKRLFGLIISGGSAGGVLGGLITNRAVRWMRTEDLLLLSAFVLLGCVFLVWKLINFLPAASSRSEKGHKTIETDSTRKLFATSPYLWMLAGIVLMAKMASTIVDNQFNATVEATLSGKEAKTAFFGGFSAILNIISFAMQLWGTSLSLRYLGIGLSLTLLPLGLTGASIITFFLPVLSTATFLKIYDGSVNYSVQQASKEVLYLPLSSGVRYRVKPVIDMLVYRASKSLGGLSIILLTPLLAIPNSRVGILVLAIIPFWIFLVWKTKDAYLFLLRTHIWKRKPDEAVSKPRRATEVLSFLYDEKSFEKLRSFLTHQSTIARKMAAAACLAYHRSGKDFQATRRLVNEMIRWEALESTQKNGAGEETEEEKDFLDELLLRDAEREVKVGSSQQTPYPQELENVFNRLRSILEDHKQGMAIKRKAALFLERQATQVAADCLLEILSKSEQHAFRFLLNRTLLRMKDRNPNLRWNRSLIKEEILREAELFQKIQRLRDFYTGARKKKEEFLEVALNALSDESLERIFRLLGLIYSGDGLRIIYERLAEHSTTDPIRVHAMELLQNLLAPEFFEIVEELFDGKVKNEVTEEEAASILEEMVVSPDRWLSLIAHFLVSELEMAKRWPRLGSLASSHSLDEALDV